MDIGIIGTGRMSAPLVTNLLADGHAVTVWNRTAAKAGPLVDAGARLAAEPAAAASAGGLLLSCLADDDALEAVFADGRVAAALAPGGVHVSMSTISAACAAGLARTHEARGASYVAAPICGRPEAVAGRLQSHLLAGEADAKQRAGALLETVSRRLFDFGDQPDRANVAKIGFNFLIASAVEAMAESFTLVEKQGLDVHAFLEMVTGTAFGCPLYEGYGRIIAGHGWNEAGFTLALGLKDVRLAAQTAADCGARMRLGELLLERFEGALAHGLGEKDWTAVTAEVRAESGL